MQNNEMIENKKMVKCEDLLKNVKNEEVRKWLLKNVGDDIEMSPTCMFLSDKATDDNSDIGRLFLITSPYNCGNKCKKSIESITKGTFDSQISGGVYNVFMPDKNTYFHAAIASDMTEQTLEILQHIKKVADNSKLKLEDLVPFKQMDSGKYGPKKNFLMLAIAKKYDNDESLVNRIPKMTEKEHKKQQEYLKNFVNLKKFGIFTEEEIEELNEDLEKKFAQGDKTIKRKEYHKEAYQEHDAELIKWLIENVPDGCLQQKDGEGYNVIDYALMKMDKGILEQLLQKDKERKLGLLKNSELLEKIYYNKFNYEEASKMVKKRYSVTQAIANRIDWYNQKRDVLGVLNAYIDNCEDAGLKNIKSMAANSNLKNTLNRGMCAIQ